MTLETSEMKLIKSRWLSKEQSEEMLIWLENLDHSSVKLFTNDLKDIRQIIKDFSWQLEGMWDVYFDKEDDNRVLFKLKWG